MEGGKAKKEGLTKKDVDPKELKMGIEIEQEHTNDKIVAERIALDHLAELPDYYTRLKKMEAEGEAAGEKKANAAYEMEPEPAEGAETEPEVTSAPPQADDTNIEETVKKIIADNPGLSDDAFHELAEQAGIDVHKAEEVAYQMAHDYTQMQQPEEGAVKGAKAESKAQQAAAGAALAAKREGDTSDLKGASKQMAEGMSESQLKDYAETKTKGLPEKKEAHLNSKLASLAYEFLAKVGKALAAEEPALKPKPASPASAKSVLSGGGGEKSGEALAADEPVKKVPEETEERQEKPLSEQKDKDEPLDASEPALTPEKGKTTPDLEQERDLNNTQSNDTAEQMSEGVGKQTDDLTMNREQDEAPKQDGLIDPERQSEEQKEAKMNYTKRMVAAEPFVSALLKAAKGDAPCPGSKIRSKGMGRGQGRGQGKGPIGVPVDEKDNKPTPESKMVDGKPCPGSKIRSKGKGLGLGRGKGKGPIGVPVGEKKGEKGMPLSEKKTFKGGKNEPASKAKPGEGGRFKALVKKLAESNLNDAQFVDTLVKLAEVRDPGALAAAIGRKKYGKKKFQEMAAAGRKKKKD